MKRLVSRIEGQGAVGRWRILVAVLTLAVLMAGAVLAVWVAARPGAGWLTALGGYLAILGVMTLLAQWLYDLDGWLVQQGRDLRARALFEQLRAGEPVEPFTLYLRPFASTDAIAEQAVRTIRPTTGGLIVSTDRLEFEGEIERALRKHGPVVALGAPLEHRGAGRIAVSDDSWQEAIARLMQAARLIVLLPSPREGTLWEVDQLIDGGHLGKTLVIDPPNRASSASGYDPAAEWAAIRAAFAERGYDLPADAKRGQLMRFEGGKVPSHVLPIRLDARGAIRSFVRRGWMGRSVAMEGR